MFVAFAAQFRLFVVVWAGNQVVWVVGGTTRMGGKVLHLLTQRHTQTGAEALAYLCKFMIAPFPFFTVSYSPRHCY